MRDKGYLPFVVAQFLFLVAVWPYLSGDMVFAPKAYVSERAFRMDGLVKDGGTARDTFGAEDYLDQERIFLKFYRESIRKGELPFWNEHTFGGISQEDSMIYSYLSPFALPWLFITNDHVAKGVQIYLLLNFGALAMIWWCRILGVGDAWTLVAIVLATLTPLAMHFQAHVHQPALYYTGLIVLATFHRLLETGLAKYKVMFFGSICLAIICNFLSALLFISMALAWIAVAHFGWRQGERRDVLVRTAISGTLYVLALTSLSFFLGPILLESHLVREPTTYTAGSFSPWGSLYSLFDATSYFRLGHGVWLPLLFALPFFILFGKKGVDDVLSVESTSRGMLLYLLFAILVSSVGPFIELFRHYFPGMQYSANGTFRLVYFANLCTIPVLAGFFTRLGTVGRKAQGTVIALLGLEFIAGLAVYLVTLPRPRMLRGLSAIEHVSDLLHTKGLVESAGISCLIALAFVLLAAMTIRNRKVLAFVIAALIGAGFVWIYTYQRPNLPVALDPAVHPIFASIPKGARVITLEDCSERARSYYRSEAALAGMDALDGPTDLGLFIKTRRFWEHWNDIPELNKHGANLMEVMWFCSERVLDTDRALNPAFVVLMRLVGTQYVFTGREIHGETSKEVARVGGLRAYRLLGQWPDAVFLPGMSSDRFVKLVAAIANGDESRLAEFDAMDAGKQPLRVDRVDNLEWQVHPVPSLSGRTGLLLMNSPVEYSNGLEVPLVHLPLEGEWIVENGGRRTSFGMTDVPLRIAELTIESGPIQIRYTLSQYYLWATVSLIGLVGCAVVIRKYGGC